MSEERLVRELIEFGLSERESSLYVAMLAQREVSAGELHRITGMNRAKTYTILAQMVSRGLCKERKDGRHRYFSAMPPASILESMKAQWQRRRQRAESVFDELDDLFVAGNGSGRLLDLVEVVRGKEQHASRLQQLTDRVKEEVLALARAPYPLLELQQEQRRELTTTIATPSTVIDRAIYMINDPSFNDIRNVLRRSVGLRPWEEMRVIDYVPLKMYIYDRKLVYMALPSGRVQYSPDSTMVLIEDPGLAELCRNAFYRLWEQAQPFPEWESQNSD